MVMISGVSAISNANPTRFGSVLFVSREVGRRFWDPQQTQGNYLPPSTPIGQRFKQWRSDTWEALRRGFQFPGKRAERDQAQRAFLTQWLTGHQEAVQPTIGLNFDALIRDINRDDEISGPTTIEYSALRDHDLLIIKDGRGGESYHYDLTDVPLETHVAAST